MDADHQHDPELLVQMLAAIESGEYDLSYASRFAEGASTDAWNRPDRVKASGIANAIARKLTGVELTDPMSGYFMLRAETLRADAHRLSGVGFKILLDILATVDAPLRVMQMRLGACSPSRWLALPLQPESKPCVQASRHTARKSSAIWVGMANSLSPTLAVCC